MREEDEEEEEVEQVGRSHQTLSVEKLFSSPLSDFHPPRRSSGRCAAPRSQMQSCTRASG